MRRSEATSQDQGRNEVKPVVRSLDTDTSGQEQLSQLLPSTQEQRQTGGRSW